MKKHILSILALCVSLLTLVFSLSSRFHTAPDSTDLEARIADLEAENEQLRARIDSLSDLLSENDAAPSLRAWELSAVPLADGSSAKIRFFAEPVNLGDGGTLTLVIRLNGKQVEAVSCIPEEEGFAAEAQLPAADGYGYYCVMTDAEGNRTQIALTTPENPVEDIPVYLASSMESYCNFLVDSWYSDESYLYLASAYAQAQLPRLGADSAQITISSAKLVLSFNGVLFDTLDISLNPDDTGSGYFLTLDGEKLSMPEMADDEFIDLALSVTLSDGTELSALGASWFFSEGELYAVVG